MIYVVIFLRSFLKRNISTEILDELEVLFFSSRKSFILRNEVYTSITDTIRMPKVLQAPDNSVQPVATPSILATQLDDRALRNVEEVEFVLFI